MRPRTRDTLDNKTFESIFITEPEKPALADFNYGVSGEVLLGAIDNLQNNNFIKIHSDEGTNGTTIIYRSDKEGQRNYHVIVLPNRTSRKTVKGYLIKDLEHSSLFNLTTQQYTRGAATYAGLLRRNAAKNWTGVSLDFDQRVITESIFVTEIRRRFGLPQNPMRR